MSLPARNARTTAASISQCLGDGAHLQIVGNHQMLITQLFAQQIGHDVMTKRRRLQQTTGDAFDDIDVGKPPWLTITQRTRSSLR